MKPLESRKYLLIAESELNRAQLVRDMAALSTDLRAIADRAKSLSTIAATGAVLVAGIAAFRHRKKPAEGDVKPSWLQGALKGATLVSSLWHSFRSNGHEQKEKQRESL